MVSNIFFEQVEGNNWLIFCGCEMDEIADFISGAG